MSSPDFVKFALQIAVMLAFAMTALVILVAASITEELGIHAFLGAFLVGVAPSGHRPSSILQGTRKAPRGAWAWPTYSITY